MRANSHIRLLIFFAFCTALEGRATTIADIVAKAKDYNAIPVGGSYYSNGLSPLVVCTVDLLMLGGIVIGIWIYRRKSKTKTHSAEPPRSSKRPGRIYCDYDQFKLAAELWDREGQLFEQGETARLADLSKKAKSPLTDLSCLSFIIAALVFGVMYGAFAGWETVFLGLVVVFLLASAEKRFYRWRHKAAWTRQAWWTWSRTSAMPWRWL
jgi:hypothetical protein